MEKCFVIQPFDNGIFDKRYHDIFEPAIKKAGLDPYRIDKDASVIIPIDDIEKGIKESALCFAEITLNNPNVWYELGYAFANNKDVVLVCSEERDGKYPFDINHRQIITYHTGSTSDFNALEESITKKILALKQKTLTVLTLQYTPVLEKEGLKSHEIAILILLLGEHFTDDETTSAFSIKKAMNSAGYTDVATSMGVRSLSKIGYLDILKLVDDWNNEYTACRLTPNGEAWILSNQDQLQFRKDADEPEVLVLPF